MEPVCYCYSFGFRHVFVSCPAACLMVVFYDYIMRLLTIGNGD